MNHEMKSDTPETDEYVKVRASLAYCVERDTADFARKLERERDRMQDLAESNGTLAHSNDCESMEYRRERDEWAAKAVELSAERESNAMQALAYKAERDYLREALSACMEDSIELLSERGWWKDESRSGYAERYAQTAENVIEAQAILATLQK